MGSLWKFDYKEAEQKRFKGTSVWDPSKLPSESVEQYLFALSLDWDHKKSGLTEETALLYLAMHNYNVTNSLKETLHEPQKLRQLIKQQNRFEEKIETMAFIGSLTSMVLHYKQEPTSAP